MNERDVIKLVKSIYGVTYCRVMSWHTDHGYICMMTSVSDSRSIDICKAIEAFLRIVCENKGKLKVFYIREASE